MHSSTVKTKARFDLGLVCLSECPLPSLTSLGFGLGSYDTQQKNFREYSSFCIQIIQQARLARKDVPWPISGMQWSEIFLTLAVKSTAYYE